MFKIGQKVVCVDNSQIETELKINQIYTITGIQRQCSCGVCVSVDNIPEINMFGEIFKFGSPVICFNCNNTYKSNGLKHFRINRFRSLDETFAEDVLAMITEQIEEEELILI